MAKGFWAIKTENEKKICKAINANEAKEFNEFGWDIYVTANEVSGFGAREKKDLISITCFFVDIESGTKVEQMKRIRKGPVPTSIIETGRGYHVYFALQEPIDCTKNPIEKADWFRNFQVTRLTPFYDGDPNATDATRIMRAPNTRYWKDTDGNFIAKNILTTKRRFAVDELSKHFPEKKLFVRQEEKSIEVRKTFQNPNGFWERCNSIPIEEGLIKLSGTSWVNGEVFSVKQERKIKRVNVNGKPSNVWIDEFGRVGSTYEKTSGTLVNFLSFPNYRHDMKTIAKIFKEVLNVN